MSNSSPTPRDPDTGQYITEEEHRRNQFGQILKVFVVAVLGVSFLTGTNPVVLAMSLAGASVDAVLNGVVGPLVSALGLGGLFLDGTFGMAPDIFSSIRGIASVIGMNTVGAISAALLATATFLGYRRKS